MPLTIAQILNIVGQATLREMPRPYTLRPVAVNSLGNYYSTLEDQNSRHYVSIVWTPNEENRAATEAQKINYAKMLLRNAIDSLDVVVQPPVRPPIWAVERAPEPPNVVFEEQPVERWWRNRPASAEDEVMTVDFGE